MPGHDFRAHYPSPPRLVHLTKKKNLNVENLVKLNKKTTLRSILKGILLTHSAGAFLGWVLGLGGGGQPRFVELDLKTSFPQVKKWEWSGKTHWNNLKIIVNCTYTMCHIRGKREKHKLHYMLLCSRVLNLKTCHYKQRPHFLLLGCQTRATKYNHWSIGYSM